MVLEEIDPFVSATVSAVTLVRVLDDIEVCDISALWIVPPVMALESRVPFWKTVEEISDDVIVALETLVSVMFPLVYVELVMLPLSIDTVDRLESVIVTADRDVPSMVPLVMMESDKVPPSIVLFRNVLSETTLSLTLELVTTVVSMVESLMAVWATLPL